MTMKRFFPLVSYLVAIALCAGLASFVSSTIVRSFFDEESIWVALGTTVLAMFLAFFFFALGVAMLRIFKSSDTNR